MRLETFQGLVLSEVQNRNPDTGELGPTQLNNVIDYYRALPEDQREAARVWLDESVKGAINELNVTKARALLRALDSVSNKRPRKVTVEKAPHEWGPWGPEGRQGN